MKFLIPFIAVLSLIASILSIIYKWDNSVSWVVIGLTDLSLLGILFISAHISDGYIKWQECLPNGKLGLFYFFLFICSIVLSFGNIFLSSRCYFNQDYTHIHDWKDALYVSVGIITTVNFGDFVPKGTYTKLAATLEIVSSVILFLGIFSILVSSISAFPKKNK